MQMNLLLPRLAPLALAILVGFGTLSCSSRTSVAEQVFSSEQQRFQVEIVVDGLEHPWGMVFLPGGDMLVTERPGRLRRISNGVLSPQAITGLPENLKATGQGGLLDITIHPQFDNNRLVYISYAGKGKGGVGTEVARAQYDADGNRLLNVEKIFRMRPKSNGGRHFGSRLLIVDDYLYISLGDRGDRQRAQDVGDHAGSLIRLHLDGSVPADNPFVAQSGALPEIYTYGNRNMQGMALQPGSDRVWTHEHGPRGGDEVNIMRAGTNYGWPEITYGINYGGSKISDETARSGMAQPVHYWVPSIAPSGMMFYDGAQFPEWQGDLFVGALKDQLLVRLEIDDERVVSEERLLSGRFGRIRDVRQGPQGNIYLLTDAADGKLLRIRPAP